MTRALKPCSVPTCPVLVERGRCSEHRREAEQRRGSAHARGYDHTHRARFRAVVLRADPVCTCIDVDHGHGPTCRAPSVHADHHPRTRRELEALGLDPNDPRYGRGLCAPCHDRHTAATSPGGWFADRY